jgi:Ser/Thr protein kinase RdoA (MazF antagonist)
VLEDLSGGHWPPPWPPGSIEALLETLGRLHATRPPDHVKRLADQREGLVDGWATIADDPEPFLGLEVCTRHWLERALPVLDESAQTAPIGGDDLLHLDVRSDNVCFLGERAVLVDWNWACSGNGILDVAAWLPSLRIEGGPEPDEVLPDCPPGFAALLAGFFGSRAGLAPPPTAPLVRPLQLRQLRVALPWAARLLGLPAPS